MNRQNWLLIAASLATSGMAFAEDPHAAERFRQAQDSIPGQYVVVLKELDTGARAESVDVQVSRLSQRFGGEVLHTYQHALRGFAVRLSEAQARRLSQDPDVEFIQEDGYAYGSATQSNPPWGLDRVDQRALPLNLAYTYGPTGSGVHAYVLDSGIRSDHLEFGGRVYKDYTAINDGWGTEDCHGHGTNVSGILGSAAYGMAKQAWLHSVRVLDCNNRGAWSGIIAGLDWVAANAQRPALVNMSLGGAAYAPVDDAVRRVIAKGISVFIAAMNDNKDACSASPARTPEAITVGATDSSDTRARFSNYGSCLDLFAPGVEIRSTGSGGSNYYSIYSGTSQATPHVAGAAALYLERNPSASVSQVTGALLNNTTPGVVANPGTGSPNRLLYSGFIP